MAETRLADRLRKIIRRSLSTAYRTRIGGFRQLFANTYRKLVSRRARAQTGSSLQRIGDPRGRFRVLYVDEGGWAIRNVALCWFSHLDGVSCTMADVWEFLAKPGMHLDFDVVVFSFTNVLRRCRDLVLARPTIACVHDPVELFDEVPDWKAQSANPEVLGLLRKADVVVSISREVQECLAKEGISCARVPTASLLPAVPSQAIDRAASGPLRAIAVGRIYRRKRFELFHEIAAASKRNGLPIVFHAKFDRSPLPEAEYISYLDRADLYIVTSFQEGGPLPAMDAMQRGLIVLSTPVGQMPEIVEDGVSGFLCNGLSEFVERLSLLAADPQLVRQMRHASLDRISQVRNTSILRDALMPVLQAAGKMQAKHRLEAFPTSAQAAGVPEPLH